MKELGENFSKSGIEVHGFSSLDNVFWNLNQEDIYKIILDRGEGKVSKDGAMVVKTGIHTGRSAQDKFVVKESKNKDSIWWDNAKEMSEENKSLSQIINFRIEKLNKLKEMGFDPYPHKY